MVRIKNRCEVLSEKSDWRAVIPRVGRWKTAAVKDTDKGGWWGISGGWETRRAQRRPLDFARKSQTCPVDLIAFELMSCKKREGATRSVAFESGQVHRKQRTHVDKVNSQELTFC